MASFKDDAENTLFDFTLLPEMPVIVDNVNDGFAFDNTLNLEPAYYPQPTWQDHGTAPFERGMFSTPTSWDPNQTTYVTPQDMARPLYSNPAMSLTTDQHERLRLIAMPNHPRYNNHNSPNSANGSSIYKSGSLSSPDRQEATKKRKPSHEDEEDDDDDDDGSNGPHPVKKTAHNMVEKRYRTNLNRKIAALRDSVPSLRVITKNSRGEDGEGEDLQGLTPAHKLNKATVLSKATEYIRHLEKRNTRLIEENQSMKARIAAFEKLFLSGSMGMNPAPQSNQYSYRQPSYATASPSTIATPNLSPPGMMEVPEDIRLLNAQAMLNNQIYAPQENYAPGRTHPQHAANGWNGGGFFGKMTVGSLAGLMILEGFSEQEQHSDTPNARGLFAIPTHLLRLMARGLRSSTTINLVGFHSSPTDTLAFIKLMMVLITLPWVFVPSIFCTSSKSKKLTSGHLSSAPYIASSIAVRRQAWLTAIQTVWVPRHNFFLEVVALVLKMVKLSLRKVIGWYGFALLTGITEQQEIARIKAWSIALDSQLAGGDVEANKTRLALTLLASSTLPDTPARLMLKALHVKILLWELGHANFFGASIAHSIADKLARWKWNDARQLQQIYKHTKKSLLTDDAEELPDHLIVLLGQECDDVLMDSICQRAYNLTYNLPTKHNAIGAIDGMDAVVEDFAIRSPLDAIAAWFSSTILQQALSTSLTRSTASKARLSSRQNEIAAKSLARDIDLALRTAPIGSVAQIRALVARAVLINEKRGDHIVAAITMISPVDLKSNTNSSLIIDATTSFAAFPDLRLSLDCAVAIAHLSRPGKPSSAAYKIIDAIRPSRLSLLGFTSTFKLMEVLIAHAEARDVCARTLETLAGGLRIWVGSSAGAATLQKQTRASVVNRCLGICTELVGMGSEGDAGYASMSEREEDGESG